MTPETEQQYKNQIAQLQAEIEKLKKDKTIKMKSEKYGLNWIDVPEAFDAESENKIPILEEVKEKAIKNDDGKPTHILIEGDNYHALTCLNYTHAGKIDVIYIDPPYNTGSSEQGAFIYNDSRYLDKYPNGKLIKKNDPLRHSAWLSFMNKRLLLAKNLLSERGIIFISIDDNEQANLKLLCDEIFGEQNFVGKLLWKCRNSLQHEEPLICSQTEYILLYAKHKAIWNYDKNLKFNRIRKPFDATEYKNPDNDPRGPWLSSGKTRNDGRPSYTVISPSGKPFCKPWIPSPNEFKKWEQDNLIWWGKNGDSIPRKKSFLSDFKGNAISDILFDEYIQEIKNEELKRKKIWEIGTTESGTKGLKDIFSGNTFFNYPKPASLIIFLIKISSSQNSKILDFFAGSGTTLHATMNLNKEDGGHRQCILVQSPEKTYEIKNEKEVPKKGSENAYNNGYKKISDITYERNRRVMQGYTNLKGEEIPGLGNSLKYYKTVFVGKNSPSNATDSDRITLAQKAGCLISLTENTLDEIETTDFYQIYTDGKRYTGVYFNLNCIKLQEFVKKIEDFKAPSTVYIFSWGSPEIFENEFDDMTNITIKSIPQPILEIYKSLNGDN